MNKNIKSSNQYIGLPREVYALKPAKSSDFKYSFEINEFNEPQNIIQEMKQLLKNVANNIKNMINTITNNTNRNLEIY